MDAQLVVLNGANEGKTIGLPAGKHLTVGRYRNNQLVLEEDQVSRFHAEITFDQGQWHIRDNDSVNGTYVDGQRIRGTALKHGQVIRIGPVQLRFECVGEPKPNEATTPPISEQPEATLTSSLLDDTPFQLDEFNALCRFMADAVDAKAPAEMIRLALRTVKELTNAEVVGFFGLDSEGELFPRVVLPEKARDEYRLSNNLTARARQASRPVWLGGEKPEPMLESLAGFEDAVCVPLGTPTRLLGVLHVYQRGRAFREHDVRLCEIVGRHLASNLRLSRLVSQLAEENSRLRLKAPPEGPFIIGDSRLMCELREKIALAAQHNANVLILGETGVGKELVATLLHKQSQRANGPLVVVNCGGIKRDFLESMLYGHSRGAFTGAQQHTGFVHRADGGSLFLDEIGELPEDGQTQFLRILEGKPFTPLGSEKDISADVRYFAATNRDLPAAIRDKKFRADLYFRLKRVIIQVPPLREHREDIPQLVQHYLRHNLEATGRELDITPAALARLQEWHWPGNVRELWGVLDTAVVFLKGDVIDAQHLLFEHLQEEPARQGPLPTFSLAHLKEMAFEQALAAANGNATLAAKMLGVARSTLVAWQGKKPEPENEAEG
jgi:Nif-specific regulatory protein